jgi:hypothetical protein
MAMKSTNLLEKKRLEIIDRFGGDQKRELGMAIKKLLRDYGNFYKRQILSNIENL